jgi:hypothetical protein
VGPLELNIELQRWLGGLMGTFHHRIGYCIGVEY